jgi:hypothetical protein
MLDSFNMILEKLYRIVVQLSMPPKESELLIAELRDWCDKKYGRRSEIAEMLGKSRQLVGEWLAGRATPTFDDGLKLQAFLKKQRRAKSRAPR